MQKPVMHKTIEEWTADTINPKDRGKIRLKKWGFPATGVYDEVNVSFTHRILGFTNHIFTTEDLKRFYGAEYCAFDTDGGIDLHFRSWDDVEVDEDGCVTKIKKLELCP